jgi:HSP20 family protein
MTLVNWSPFREIEDLFNQYNRLLARPTAGERENGQVVQWRPTANISETDREYIIRAELPEVEKKDIEVTVHEGVLTVKGERRLERKDDSEKHHRIESFYGSFARSFTLPSDVDESGIVAETKDGVLTVRLPKSEAAKPRAIEVKVR